MKKNVTFNGICNVNMKKYNTSTLTQHFGLISIVIGVIMAIIGTVFKSRSYEAYVDDNIEKTIELNVE